MLNKTINYADLKKLVSLNPASSTRIFHETNKLIFDHIIAIPIDGCGFNITRKSVSCANRTKGAFGKALAFAGVGEVSGRFADHHHVVVFMSIPSLNTISENNTLVKAVAEGIDSILKNELSIEQWQLYLARRHQTKQEKLLKL